MNGVRGWVSKETDSEAEIGIQVYEGDQHLQEGERMGKKHD